FRTQASHPRDRPPDHGTEVLITRTDEGLARDAGELFPAPVTTGAPLLPRAAGDIRRRRGEALDPPERFVVDPCLAHHAERVRAKTPVLQEVKRRELDVDDAVMTSMPHRGDRKLELISEEGIGAKLPEHVRTDEEIRDTEGTPLLSAQDTCRDQRGTVLHRVPRGLRRRERPRLVRCRRDPRDRPPLLH